jgi:hypothetical protein
MSKSDEQSEVLGICTISGGDVPHKETQDCLGTWQPVAAPEKREDGLKPCPFCGQAPPINRPMLRDGWLIECCYAVVVGGDEQLALTIWNTRALPAPPEASK